MVPNRALGQAHCHWRVQQPGTQLHCTQKRFIIPLLRSQTKMVPGFRAKKAFFCKHYRNFKADQVFISPT